MATEVVDVQALKDNMTPVKTSDIMAEAGRKILLSDLVKMLENEAGSRTGEDIENVHNMRVATRRMRSTLELLEDYYKRRAIRPHIKQLRKLARRLGSVRDLDVMIADLSKHQSTLDEEGQHAVQGIIGHLDQKRAKARKKLVAYLDSKTYRKFVTRFAGFLTSPGKGAKKVDTGGSSPHQVRHVLPVNIQQHLAAVRAYDTLLEQPDPKTLHQLRIELKRLRYLISGFQGVLGASADDFIAELKALQDYLGRFNDVTVARSSLQTLASKNDFNVPQITALHVYTEQLAGEEPDSIAKFPDAWAKFNSRTVQRKLSDAMLVLR